MKYVLYNDENEKYIKADSRFGYTETIDDALKFNDEETANSAMTNCPASEIRNTHKLLYDISSQIIMMCENHKLSVIEVS